MKEKQIIVTMTHDLPLQEQISRLHIGSCLTHKSRMHYPFAYDWFTCISEQLGQRRLALRRDTALCLRPEVPVPLPARWGIFRQITCPAIDPGIGGSARL